MAPGTDIELDRDKKWILPGNAEPHRHVRVNKNTSPGKLFGSKVFLPEAKYFSTFDAASGFWQIPLDEASSRLTTFNTPLVVINLTVSHLVSLQHLKYFSKLCIRCSTA